MRNKNKIWSDNCEGRDHLEDLGADGTRILKQILRQQGWKMWTGFMWLRRELVAGCCEHGNEPSCSIKGGEFLD
jgi:hypothetical protein